MKENCPTTAAIILAAGIGSRMGMRETKQTLDILGKSVLRRTLEAFDAADTVSSIIVVTREEEHNFVNKECHGLLKPFTLVNGGFCRAESSALGFSAVSDKVEYVLIHDGVRCLVTAEEINKVAYAMYEYGAATASRPITDTIKKCTPDGRVCETVDRENLKSVATPQGFRTDIYKRAIESVPELTSDITDDNMLAEKIGIYPYCVETLPTNIKITAPSDIELAEYIITKRERGKV